MPERPGHMMKLMWLSEMHWRHCVMWPGLSGMLTRLYIFRIISPPKELASITRNLWTVSVWESTDTDKHLWRSDWRSTTEVTFNGLRQTVDPAMLWVRSLHVTMRSRNNTIYPELQWCCVTCLQWLESQCLPLSLFMSSWWYTDWCVHDCMSPLHPHLQKTLYNLMPLL